MHHINFRFISSFCLISAILTLGSSVYGASPITIDKIPLKTSVVKYIQSGELYGKSEVSDTKLENDKDGQKLDFLLAGLHKKSCSFAFRKLSLYENYSQYLDYIKQSHYSDKTQTLTFLVSHKLMPFDMTLTFKLERIKGPGVYKFVFEKSFLKGLTGEIHVSKHKRRCFIYSTAKWKGPKSPIPSIVFEFFTEALGKLALENLFRVSSTY